MDKLKLVGNLFTEIFGRIPYETPKYEVLRRFPANGSQPAFEVRRYAPCVAATVSIADLPARNEQEFNNKAFGALARYIGVFSKPENSTNDSSQQIAMTSPVTTESAKGQKISMTSPVTTESEKKISMTAPVSTEGGQQAAWTGKMSFFLPSIYTKAADAPTPLNSSVKLVDVPAREQAVITFTWRFSRENCETNKQALAAAIEAASSSSGGAYTLTILRDDDSEDVPYTSSGYNAPFCIPFLRTNEVSIPVTFKLTK